MPIIRLYNSTTASSVPTAGNLATGRLAINVADTKAWIGDGSNNPIQIIGTIAHQAANSVSITGGTISGVTIGATTKSTGTLSSTLTIGASSVTAVSTDGTLAGNSNSTIPTSSAAKTYADGIGANRLKNIYSWTSSGTFTYTKSGTDVQRVQVICVGGGGGARAYSECGGAGGYAENVFDATGMTTVTVTVGGGGAGGVYFGFSGDGGTSSFGSYISSTGGYGSSRNEQHSGGHGGFGTGGAINAYGGMGGSHNNLDQYSPSCASGSQGGGSFFGGGMIGDRPDWSQAEVAAPGSGGVAISPGHNGQGGRTGRPGAVVVYEYK